MSVKEEVSKKVMQGVVVSNKMNKTIVVRVDRRIKHHLYQKIINRSSKISVHDPEDSCNIGDTVQIQECKPISKNKAWMLVKILKRVEK